MSSATASPLKPLCTNSTSILAPSAARKPSTVSSDDATPVKTVMEVNVASDVQPPPQPPAVDENDDEVIFGRTDEELAVAEARRRALFSKMYKERNASSDDAGAAAEAKAPAVPVPATPGSKTRSWIEQLKAEMAEDAAAATTNTKSRKVDDDCSHQAGATKEQLEELRVQLEQAHAAKMGELRGQLTTQHALEMRLVEQRGATVQSELKQQHAAQMAQQQQRVAELQAALDDAKCTTAAHGDEYNALKAQIVDLEAKRERLEGVTQHYQEQNTELRQENTQRKAELEAATAQAATLEKAVKQRDAALELKEKQRVADVAEMKQKVGDRAREMMEDGNKRYAQLKSSYARKKALLDELQPKLAAGAAEAEKLEKRVEESQATAARHEKAAKKAETEVAELRAKLKAAELRADTAEASVKTLTTEIQDAKRASSEASKRCERSVESEAESAKARQALEAENNALKVQIFDATQKVGSLEADAAEAKQKAADLEGICEELMTLAEKHKQEKQQWQQQQQ